jgi:hypothetical protein
MAAGAELLAELLKPSRLTSVVDAGLGPAAQPSPYGAMLGKRLCSVVGLEPRLDSRQPPSQSRSDLETLLAVTAGDGAPATLKLCTAPGMNSLLAPNPQVVDCFPLYAGFADVIGECPLETRRLDDIVEIPAIDFLKIDMQGSETAAFRGGPLRLAEAVVVQTEVCFMELYKDQALFADTDEALRAHGFIPHIFGEVNKALIQPLAFTHKPYHTFNHGIFCDIVYVRDFSRIDAMSVEQLKHLALIANYCFRSFDLALRCLEELEVRKVIAADAIDRYLGAVARGVA